MYCVPKALLKFTLMVSAQKMLHLNHVSPPDHSLLLIESGNLGKKRTYGIESNGLICDFVDDATVVMVYLVSTTVDLKMSMCNEVVAIPPLPFLSHVRQARVGKMQNRAEGSHENAAEALRCVLTRDSEQGRV